MGIYRQFSDEALESHLQPLTAGELANLTDWLPAKAFKLHTHAPGTFLDWHPAGSRYLIVVLSGLLEITVTDGTRLLCHPGDARFTSDQGKGHTGRAVGEEPCTVLMVDLEA
jgi:quercetin dioxygenase-like cupin family protein